MRFDRLPMDRSAQSAGSGEALFERREVDPSYPLTQKRRPGSLRQDDYSAAPGLRCEADAAYGYLPNTVDGSAGFSVAFSLTLDSMGDTTATELIGLYSVEDASSANGSFVVTATKTSATKYSLKLTVTDSLGATVTATLTSRDFGTGQHVAFFHNTSTNTVSLRAIDVGGGNANSNTPSVSTLTLSATDFYLHVSGNPSGPTKAIGEPFVVSNVGFWDEPQVLSSIQGVRDPASVVYYWSMRDPYRVMASEGSSAGFFFLHPAPPAIASSACQFGGRSGAIAIEGSLDTERFFSTAAEAVADKEFTIYLKGTRGNRGATSREEILFDYGDLAQIHFNATTNTVDFIYNGVTTSSDAVAPDAAFEIYAGRNGSTLFCYVVGGTEGTDITNPAAPFLDYSAAPTIYIGAEADVTQDTRYVGSLTKVALWPERTLTDLGARTAAFYLDLSDAIEDKSPNGAAVTEEIHSSDSGDPHFVAGPIDDAAHRTCEGGLVLGDSGPVASGWDVALDKRIEGDATGIRFGRRVIVTSQDIAHVLDSEAKIGRPFGIPQPPPGVSTTALGSGPLDGVYSYGYRFLSRDGTYGPVRRLDPVKATSGARVVVGSTGGTGESELGETYGNIPASTTSSFYKSFSSDPGVGTYTAEVYARLLNHEPEEVHEDTMERGMVTTGNGISFLKSGSPSPIDLGDDFTIQCDFRYRRRNGLSVDGIVSTLICGFGSDNTDENADFFAAIIGDTGGNASQVGVSGRVGYTSRFPNNDGAGDALYGDTEPRLVVGIPRRKIRADREFGSGRNFPSENYFLATFTDDSTWTDGNDYSVIFARTGNDLRVLVRNRTAGGAYTELTGRTMATSGVASSGGGTGAATGYGTAKFSGTDTRSFNYSSGASGDFFRDWSPKLSSRKAWFGNAGRRIVIPFISNESGTKGVPEHADHRYPDGAIPELDIDELDCSLKSFDDDTEMYHFRVWDQYISPPVLAGHANRRFAARAEEPLNGGIVHDVACVVEDVSGFTRKVQDVASGQIFSVYKSFSELVKATYFAQDTASLKPDRQHLFVLEDNSGGPGKAVELYWTSEGNGSWRLGINGEEYYNILGRTAEPFNANASQRIISRDTAGINDIIAPDDEYNWFSFQLKKLSTVASLTQTLNLAINGAPVFTVNLGGVTTQTSALYEAHVGGWDGVTGDKQVAVGEFRLWDDGQGPDPETGDDFDYLGGRVSENEFANLLSYMKFQPVDDNTTTLTGYGSDAGTITIGGTASIVDPRGTSGLIGFPSAPAEYITGVEILRSVGVSVQDPEDESEVQEALDEARGAPLYRLAVIPTGSSHYVDSASDGALGFEVDTRTGYVPQVIKGAFIWQGQIGLAGDKTTLHFAEPGPFGWESYPRWLDYEVPGAGGDLTAATSAGNLAYAFGKTWAVAMAGSPSNPEPVGLGGGVGATDQRSVAAWGDKLFAHNGQLWHIQGAQAVDIGGPVRDLLPDAGSCRLVVSALLSSLLVIDTSSGLVLRFYFPTGQWSIEDRYVLAAGDLADGSATAFISLSGTYAQSSSSYVADDVEASTDTSGSGTLSGDTVTLGANITIPTLCRVQVEDANGVTAAAVATESGSTGTLTFPANSMSALAAGAVTVRPGVPAEGMVIDTGWINHGYSGHLRNVLYTVDSGSDWEIGADSGATAGSRASRSGVSYAGVAGTGERLGVGHGGRYVRLVARNLGAEFGEIGCLETDMRPGGVAQ